MMSLGCITFVKVKCMKTKAQKPRKENQINTILKFLHNAWNRLW